MADEQTKIEAIKGFDANLQCRNFQFEIGKTYTQDGEIVLCGNGFHAIEGHPLDVFNFYAAAGSRFAIVECSGDIARGPPPESKIASATITIKTELHLYELIQRTVEWVTARAKPENGASATGHRGAASATGDLGAASATGDLGAASATGDRGRGIRNRPPGRGIRNRRLWRGIRNRRSGRGIRNRRLWRGIRNRRLWRGIRNRRIMGAASATGDYGAASATGHRGAASATGDLGAASATGYPGRGIRNRPPGRGIRNRRPMARHPQQATGARHLQRGLHQSRWLLVSEAAYPARKAAHYFSSIAILRQALFTMPGPA